MRLLRSGSAGKRLLWETIKKLRRSNGNPASVQTGDRRAWASVQVVMTAVAAFIFLEALLFRSGFYARYLDPNSSTGIFEADFRDERNRRPIGPNDVLIMGDSRIGEGFSAPIANSALGKE